MKIISNKSIQGNVWIIDEETNDGDVFDILIKKRNIKDIENFLNPTIKYYMPNPFILKDMEKAINIVIQSIQNNEKITVYGDYDVDGVTSTSVLVKYFKSIGVNIDWYIPNRESEGYGLNYDAINKIKESGTNLIITVDCGINGLNEVELVKKQGMKIIITDHHEQDEVLPNADAIINPKQKSDTSNLKYLAGVGVAFLFIVALNSKIKNSFSNKINLIDFLDLVALGTVCDSMPLIKLNRAFVVTGLKVLNARKNIGLDYLMNIAGIDKATEYSLGFVLGPRINAAGRLENPEIALKLLLTNDENKAQELAYKLNELNKQRINIQNAIIIDAISQAEEINNSDKNSLFVFGKTWHSGLMGIIAGKLKEKYNKPVCVATSLKGSFNGSGRSVDNIDLGQIIHEAINKDILISGGGHVLAAGFSLDETKLLEFSDFLEKAVNKQLNGKKLTKNIIIDLEIPLQSINKSLVENIAKLEPFGQGNAEPNIVVKSCRLKNIMRINNTKHIRGCITNSFGNNLSFIGFNMIDSPIGKFLLDYVNINTNINMLGKLKLNEYLGNKSIQLILEDISL